MVDVHRRAHFCRASVFEIRELRRSPRSPLKVDGTVTLLKLHTGGPATEDACRLWGDRKEGAAVSSLQDTHPG